MSTICSITRAQNEKKKMLCVFRYGGQSWNTYKKKMHYLGMFKRKKTILVNYNRTSCNISSCLS